MKEKEMEQIAEFINEIICNSKDLEKIEAVRKKVIAGVPILIPLGSNGLLLSNGIVFLLTVIFAFSKAFSASFPEIFLLDRSSRIR